MRHLDYVNGLSPLRRLCLGHGFHLARRVGFALASAPGWPMALPLGKFLVLFENRDQDVVHDLARRPADELDIGLKLGFHVTVQARVQGFGRRLGCCLGDECHRQLHSHSGSEAVSRHLDISASLPDQRTP